MRPTEFPAEAITTLLRKQKIASMPELMAALGSKARRTVFRKLKGLPYRASYSHRGRYYALDDVARFDELGLWSCREVWFSICGCRSSKRHPIEPVRSEQWLRVSRIPKSAPMMNSTAT